VLGGNLTPPVAGIRVNISQPVRILIILIGSFRTRVL
jgi:hypothetical protein